MNMQISKSHDCDVAVTDLLWPRILYNIIVRGNYKNGCRQPKLLAGMGTWPKLADRSVWAHGNTRKGGKKKRKRLPPTGAEPGACAWELSATAAAPPIRPRDALSRFPFYPSRSGAGSLFRFFFPPFRVLPCAHTERSANLAMCPYRPGAWVDIAAR